MGKAAVELPDPLEKNANGAADAGGADDLLSQLAGDEIDRLLSEAEVEKSEPIDPAAVDAQAAPDPDAVAAAATAQAEAKDELSAQLDSLFEELKAAPIEVPKPKAPPPPAAGEAETKPALEAPAATVAAPAPAIAEAAPKTEPVVAPQESAPASTAPATAAPAASVELETSQAERAALTPAAAADELLDPAAVLESNPIENESVDDADAPLPLVLRPLEWINLPFALCSQPMRDVLGKVAILTLVNALGVLAYVALFRRH